MKKLICIFVTFISICAAQTINPKTITVTSDAITAFNIFAASQGYPSTSTFLTLGVDTIGLTIKVDSGAGIKVGNALKIDNEVVIITAKAGKDLTISRGEMGTVVMAHDINASVSLLKYATLEEFARLKAIDAIRELVSKYMPDVDAQEAALIATKKSRVAAAVQ